MKTINSVSGGRTSSFMAVNYPTDINIFACVCIDSPEAAPKDDSIYNYCLEKLDGNFIASAERQKTLKAMMDLEQLIGKEIVWVRGKSFDTVVDEAGCLPTWNRRFCTTYLKIQPIFEHLYFRYGLVSEQIGFRYCVGCHHKSKLQIRKNFNDEPEIMRWFSKQEQTKKKFNTWHDDRVSYEEIFNMNFSELIEYGDGVSCDTGYCISD